MSKTLGYIDFAAVKAATTLEQILTHYGILAEMKPSGPNLRGCCPIHKGSNPNQFSVNLAMSTWNCFSECKHGGNHLDFVVHMENCSPHEAAWKLNEWFNLGQEKQKAPERGRFERRDKPSNKSSDAKPTTPPSVERPSKSEKQHPVESETEEIGENKPLAFALEKLDAAHPYLTERGLNAETVAHFGIGHCPKGILAGRIAIPIHNAAGQLVGNAGRWPGEPPEGKEKYRLPGKFKKTLEVFNLHRAALESDDLPLVIVEGFFPLMHLWQHGIRRIVALMGWFMSGRQEELIAEVVTPESRIILMLDNDEAGISARQQIAPRLAEHCFVRSYRWPEGIKQPDDLGEDHFAELMA